MVSHRKKSIDQFYLASAFSLILSSALILGCGDTPSEPEVVLMGAIEISAYYDTTWTDSLGVEHSSKLAPWVKYKIDNYQDTVSFETNPDTVENIFPGIHSIYVEYGDYNTTFIDTVESGMISSRQPLMSLLAPDFTLPAIRYDITQPDSLKFTDSLSLYDFLADSAAGDTTGEVVLLFFFGQT